ncbi:MAG: IclR family transcriptional regulator [Eubacteriales bacterium]|nr:IclR family transcriptional regulator [Eubacteriales bacterium]
MTKENNKTSIEKALEILSVFSEEPYEYSVMDIVKITGMNRTTVYRDLTSLENYGFIMRSEDDRYYTLGPLAYHMGSAYLTKADYEEKILSLLEKIGEETKESVGLARRDGEKIVSIYSIEIHQAIKVNDKPGTFYPINRGTYGKCLTAFRDNPVSYEQLAEMNFEKETPQTLTDPQEILDEYDRIRKDGYVLSIEESFTYAIGVGVPLRSPDGRVRNVVAVSFFKQDGYEKKVEEILKILFKYQHEIEKYLR